MSSIPSVVAVLDAGRVRTEQILLAPPADDEIDVEITLAALCGSDVHTINGDRPCAPLTALGHEGVGRVVTSGSGRTDLHGARLEPGDRVALSMLASCGHCDRCTGGLTMKCRHLVKYGHRSVTEAPYSSGMIATVVRMMPGAPVVKLPDTLDDRSVVSAGCAVATAAAAIRVAGIGVGAELGAGDRVGVLGAGAVGWYVAAMARTRGCQVTVVEPNPDRRELVAGTGAITTAEATDLADVEPVVTIEASGHPQAVAAAVETAPIGGRVVCVGSVSPGSTTITIDPAIVVTRWLSVLGVHNYAPEDFGAAVDWLVDHADQIPAELVSDPYRMDQLDEAVEQMVSGRHPRVAIDPQL